MGRRGEKYYAIINAAIKVVGENGYYGAQVAKIAKEAGVAEGTIYLYFENKEDILISLFKEKMRELTSTVKAKLATTDDVLKKLEYLIETHFKFLEADLNLARVMQIELRQPKPSIRARLSEPLKEYFQLIEDMVTEGVAKGCFRSDIYIRLTSRMIFGTMDEVVTCWVMSRRNYSLSDQVHPVAMLLLNGLANNVKKEETLAIVESCSM